MKQTITENEFVTMFNQVRSENFSDEALRALFQYHIELEEELGTELEFDPIAICCEYSEFDDAIEACKEYGFDYSDDIDNREDALEECLEHLRYNTSVIALEGSGVVIVNY